MLLQRLARGVPRRPAWKEKGSFANVDNLYSVVRRNPSWGCVVALSLVLGAVPLAVATADVIGSARAVDGDTLDIAGFRVDLWGIDAPERGQRCWYNKGGEWNCGAAAQQALSEFVGANEITCVEKARRPSGRMLGICTASETGTELNEAMVLLGLALSDQRQTRAYAGAEGYAKGALRGMWVGRFIPPSHWLRLYRYRMKGLSP